MRVCLCLLFLTLVGSFASAAPVAETPAPEYDESLQISGPRATSPLTRPEPWGVRRVPRSPSRLQTHLGYMNGAFFEKEKNESSPFVGVLFWMKSDPGQAWDFSMDFAFESWFRVAAGKRYTLSESRTTRPYARWGISQTSETDGLPADVLDLEGVKVAGGVGFANLFDENEHWNLQADLEWGLRGPAMRITLGWNIDL